MKANAPEKIYLRHNHKGDIGAGWLIFPLTNNDIEYIRKDAFIEKACRFISDRVDIIFNVECSNGEPLADSYIEYVSARLDAANKIIDEFRNYMKGE